MDLMATGTLLWAFATMEMQEKMTMNKRTLFIVVIMVLLLCFGGCTKEKTTNSGSRGSLQHDFPKPLLDFEAKSRSIDAIDLTAAETLRVFVSCSLYVEPEQVFHDPEIIAAVAKALESVEVTGNHDGVNYEDCGATVYGFYFEKADGERIAHFRFQHDENLLLAETEGRYPVTGYTELFSVEGIRLSPDDWQDSDDDGNPVEDPVPVADPLPEPIPQLDEALREPLLIPGLSELICTKTAG